jgi:hypothetical protein
MNLATLLLMIVGGREFSDEIFERIRETVRSARELTRSALARSVCEWLGWHGPDGKPKEMSCRATLVKLERRGLIELPAAREVNFGKGKPRAAKAEWEWPQVKARLATLGKIELKVVTGNAALSRQWRAMMKVHHPLGDGPLCGAQLRYLIVSERGVLGGLSFSAAAWRLGVRDEWIEWSDATRAAHLSMVISNSRFLLLPTVEVAHLASHVLSLATKRVAADWFLRYGYKPVLVETFVDSERYAGTCYRAANWHYLGLTQGRGRQDGKREASISPKHVLVFPLQRNWRKVLTAPRPLPRLTPTGRTQPPVDWVAEEFGRCQLNSRLTQRLLTLTRDFWARPMANIPEACENKTKTQAAYRFLSNDDVLFETLLQPHCAATEQRISELSDGEIVLVPQDTTSINYSKLLTTAGLGPIGTTVDGPQGFHLHSNLAITAQGVPLGFLDAQCWARDPAEFGKKAQRHSRAIEEKESYRWLQSYQTLAQVQTRCPQQKLVSVGDREADIYELFADAVCTPNGPALLIRAQHDRVLEEDEPKYLFDTIKTQPIAGYQVVQLPRQKNRPAREAKLAIRFATLILRPPARKRDLPPIPIQVVLAQETNAPKGSEPIEWLLLTTLAVESVEQAAEKVTWYTQRWCIEVFHRTLKSGCNIEDRRLGHADRLDACLAIDMVIAWRIYYMVKLGRDIPDLPADLFLEEAEWKTLCVYSTKNPVPPEHPPTIREASRMIATIGGFQGRKSDGEPGTETLWRGLERLHDMTGMWRIMAGGP